MGVVFLKLFTNIRKQNYLSNSSCFERMRADNEEPRASVHEELEDVVPAADGGVVQRRLAVVVPHVHLHVQLQYRWRTTLDFCLYTLGIIHVKMCVSC